MDTPSILTSFTIGEEGLKDKEQPLFRNLWNFYCLGCDRRRQADRSWRRNDHDEWFAGIFTTGGRCIKRFAINNYRARFRVWTQEVTTLTHVRKMMLEGRRAFSRIRELEPSTQKRGLPVFQTR
jgi:hypothetical protein